MGSSHVKGIGRVGLTCGSHIVAEPVPSEPTSLKGEGKAVPLEQAVADDGKGSRLVLLGASTVAESGGEPLYTSIRPVWPGPSCRARLHGRLPSRRKSGGARRRRPRRRCDDRRPPSPLRRDDRRQRPRRWRGILNPFARCTLRGGSPGQPALASGAGVMVPHLTPGRSPAWTFLVKSGSRHGTPVSTVRTALSRPSERRSSRAF